MPTKHYVRHMTAAGPEPAVDVIFDQLVGPFRQRKDERQARLAEKWLMKAHCLFFNIVRHDQPTSWGEGLNNEIRLDPESYNPSDLSDLADYIIGKSADFNPVCSRRDVRKVEGCTELPDDEVDHYRTQVTQVLLRHVVKTLAEKRHSLYVVDGVWSVPRHSMEACYLAHKRDSKRARKPQHNHHARA